MSKQLEFRDVLLGYNGSPVLPKINLEIHKGDFLGVVGPNGVGKTTFLKAVLGLLKPIEGEIDRTGSHLYGYVPQKQAINELFPLSAYDVVSMSRTPRRLPFMPMSKEDRETVNDALKTADIEDIASKPFRSLSGGQKQRALIARALASSPEILILDEPTNGMDIVSEKKIMDLITDLNNRGITIIMVTHLLNLVVNRTEKLMLINHGILQGKTDEIIKSESLSKTYGENVDVFFDSREKAWVTVR